INDTIFNDFNAEECNSYTWNDSTYHVSGDYVQTFTSYNNCDSVVTLHLTLYYDTATVWSDTACETFSWNDSVYTQSGEYIQHFQTIHGCDSTVTLNLTILHATAYTDVHDTCDTFTWIDGITYTESTNTPTFTLVNAVGCDSVVTLNLTVRHSTYYTDIHDTCDSFTWIDGVTYTESTDTPTFILPNAAGCDSIVTLNLTIRHSTYYTDVQNVCDSITWIDGVTYTESTNIPTFTITNAAGCDSIVTLNLTVRHSTSYTDVQDVCDSLTWIDGITYTESTNTPIFTLVNAAGCDSVVTLNLTVRHSTYYTDVHDVCDTFTWIDGITYTESNHTATYTLPNAVGCDSVVTLNLTVRHSTYYTDTYDVCDSLTWIDGITYTESTNIPTFIIPNAVGCDSVVTLNLTVRHSTYYTDIQDVCDSLTWIDGITYTESTTTPTFIIPNAAGCDSIVTLNLTIRHSTTYTDVHEVCDSLTWIDGITYYESTNTPTFTLVNAVGCDSLVTLHLTVNHSDTTHFSVTECDSYTWNNVTYTNTGIYTQPFNTVHGCDSTVFLHLTIYYSVDTSMTLEVCNSYTWNDSVYTQSGTYVQQFLTSHNCDSTVTLHLTVYHDTATTFYAAACDSYVWNDSTYTQSGDYTRDFLTTHGCDSIVTMHLIISHSSSSEFADSGCESYTWNNQTYTQSGTYTQTFANAVGCDSTVTLNLTIYNPVHTAVTQLACETYTWHGQTYTQSGTYTYTHTDAHGCTQVDTLHLDIGHPNHTAVTETACETFTWNGQTYTQSGNYTYSHTDTHGCTQVDTLHLTVHHAVHEATTEVVCDSYSWNGQTYTQSGNYTYSHTDVNGCTQVDTLHLTVHYSANTEEDLILCREELPYTWNDTVFDIDAPTSTTLVFHFATVEGCDSTVTLHLTVNDPVHTAVSDFACDNYHWNGQTYTETGTYTFSHADENGCTQVDTLHLTFLDTTIRIVPLTHNFCDAGSLTLEAQCVLEDYLWSTGETSSIITVYDEGTYTVTASQGSCEVSTSYTIVPCEQTLILPNAFTPDGDGLNDEFSIPDAYFDQIGDAVFDIRIYNRWGEIVYHATSKYFRWNGEVNGQVYHNNVYNYVIEYNTPAGSPRKVTGSITVL
ncbi:MAG: gliding motility-associated C-terminal domain-containing protein, partial [Bacteroidales bacterium]|nr:gliding motility-associated C-terminal domain-containing protein [Bacteroidales bacterium]